MMEGSTLSDRMHAAMTHRISISGRRERVSKSALARACGVSAPSVHDWFSGKSKSLSGSHLLNAAAYLCVRPEWLADGTGQMTSTGPLQRVKPPLQRRQDDPFILVPDQLPTDTIGCLRALLDQALRGEIVGIAFAAMLKRGSIVNAAGLTHRAYGSGENI